MVNKRSIILINKGFQLRFSFYVCSWMFALGIAYPFIIANIFDYLIATLARDPLGPQVSGLMETRDELFWILILMQLVFAGFTCFISIFLSHKIAGPLFKLKRFFHEAAAGNISQKLSFRSKDYFQELVPEYNAMMESIGARIDQTGASITEAIPLIEKASMQSSPEIRRELNVALKILKESIKTPSEKKPSTA